MCSGTELTLLDCSYDSTRDGNDHSRDMIVHCQQRKVTQNNYTHKKTQVLSFVASKFIIQDMFKFLCIQNIFLY